MAGPAGQFWLGFKKTAGPVPLGLLLNF